MPCMAWLQMWERFSYFTQIEFIVQVRQCKFEFYEHCVIGKQINNIFDIDIHTCTRILNYIHSNVWESSLSHSYLGKKNILLLLWMMIRDLYGFISCNRHLKFFPFSRNRKPKLRFRFVGRWNIYVQIIAKSTTPISLRCIMRRNVVLVILPQYTS